MRPNIIKSAKGFTLIELLISVVIISLLAAIVYSKVEPNRNSAKASKVIAAVQDTYAKSKNYYGQYGTYAGFDDAAENNWVQLQNAPGQLDPAMLSIHSTPGAPSTSGRVYIKVIASAAGADSEAVLICSTAPNINTYCLKDDGNKVSYLKILPNPTGSSSIYSFLGLRGDGFPLVNQSDWAG